MTAIQQPKQFLIIEPSSAVRTLVAQTITGQKYDILEAATGLDGLQMACSSHPQMIFIGESLPDVHSKVLYSQLKSNPDLVNALIFIRQTKPVALQKGVCGMPAASYPQPQQDLHQPDAEATPPDCQIRLENMEKELEQLRVQNAFMSREIHHRVRNNLQIVTSLLSLQVNQTTDPHAATALKQSYSRVQAMNTVHRLGYQSLESAWLNLDECLTKQLKTQTINRFLYNVDVETMFDKVMIIIEQAILCNLIFNELLFVIINQLTQSHETDSNNQILIKLQHTANNQVQLTLLVDAPDHAPVWHDDENDLSWQLVDLLVMQLDGEFKSEAITDWQTAFTVTFQTQPELH